MNKLSFLTMQNINVLTKSLVDIASLIRNTSDIVSLW